MLPLLLLKTATRHPVVGLSPLCSSGLTERFSESPGVQLVELKNGETYNGHMVQCDSWMNVHLREVICTSKVVLAGFPMCCTHTHAHARAGTQHVHTHNC